MEHVEVAFQKFLEIYDLTFYCKCVKFQSDRGRKCIETDAFCFDLRSSRVLHLDWIVRLDNYFRNTLVIIAFLLQQQNSKKVVGNGVGGRDLNMICNKIQSNT